VWLLVVMRVLVLSLAGEVGGLVRDATDVVWAFAVGADAPDVDDDCPFDRDDCHCPPGCPNCHCSHGVASLPVVAEAPPPLVDLRRPEVVRLSPADATPPVPLLRSVYRPPRAAAAPAS
jgi:hypothetical protein